MNVENLGKIMTKLGKKYENEKILYDKLLKIYKNLENIEFIEDISRELDNLQLVSDEYYEKYGLIDEVLDLQLLINEARNKYDIPDPKEVMGNGFVQ